jgi:putative YphP/YqiW family bacilliredoxin
MYDERLIEPMRKEMIDAGFQEARTAEEVDTVFSEKDSAALFFINSVCGCAAGIARPGVIAALDHENRPKRLVTSFAGNDAEAVNRARELFAGYPPSSPCAAVIRDGQVVHMVERHHIEGQTAENVAKILKSAYDKYCGESIDEEAEIFDPLQELQIGLEEARRRRSQNADLAFLDVREEWERSKGMIEGAIPVDQAKAQEIIGNWAPDREIIVYCEHGTRSLDATRFFQSHGFENIKSLSGGYAEWSATL